MPYDTRMDAAMQTLRGPRDAHRSAVVAAVDEIRGLLAAHRDAGDDRAGRMSRELGPFVAGRLDARALSAVLSAERRTLDPAALTVLKRALVVMTEAVDGVEESTVLEVPPGGDLRDVVRDALHATGVVFGAARAAELARNGAYRPDEHDALFSGKPFHRWSPAERRAAAPLVVTVEGADLRPAGLSDFLDGGQKIVLLVLGDAPPAALARVITPGVAVVQTRDAAELDLVAKASGPGLAALFEADAEGPVGFVHDPAAGALPWQRLRVGAELGELRERLETTRWKDRTWAEDLAHLVALAAGPGAAAGAEGVAAGDGEADDSAGVDRLAAWLLATTEL